MASARKVAKQLIGDLGKVPNYTTKFHGLEYCSYWFTEDADRGPTVIVMTVKKTRSNRFTVEIFDASRTYFGPSAEYLSILVGYDPATSVEVATKTTQFAEQIPEASFHWRECVRGTLNRLFDLQTAA